MNPAIFREYDIRGVADRDYDAKFARKLGGAYAAFLDARGAGPAAGAKRRVAVGRDCRLTSDRYAEALRAGLRAAGVDVVDIGICPTPLMYFSLFDLDLDGGIQVTGSHNPPTHNGFKICVGRTTIHGDDVQELRRLLEAGRFPSGTGGEERIDIIPRYTRYMARHFAPVTRPISVVVDAGNSVAGPVAPRILRALGCTVDELYCEMDGRFPNHHPDPTVPENLSDLVARVRGTAAELGIGFDGDADRIGVVDGRGRIIWGDELLVLFARDVLASAPGATIVSEVKCSQRLFDDIAARGGRGIMWRAGHSPIKAKMKEERALLGGEISGHMFFADRYFGYDDAIYAACRVVEILSKTGKRIEELLADLPRAFSTPELRVDCPDDIKFSVVERALSHFRRTHEVIDVDGVRVKFPGGWGLVRASNTQPALVLRFEATSEAALRDYQRQFEEVLAAIRVRLG